VQIGSPGFAPDHYWNAMRRFYLDNDSSDGDLSRNTRGIETDWAPVTFSQQDAEPDSTIATIIGQWAPHRFDQTAGCTAPDSMGGQYPYPPYCTGLRTVAGPGYEVNWFSTRCDGTSDSRCSLTYEVRHSTTSLKTLGFSHGLCNDGSTTCTIGNGDRISAPVGNGGHTMWWSRHDVSSWADTELPDVYIAIRPEHEIISTSGNGQSPIVLNFRFSPDMVANDHVTVTGVSGNTAANVSNVAILGATPELSWFRFSNSGVQVCSQSGSSPVQLVTCSPHGFTTGQHIRIDYGSSGGTGSGGSGYWWTVTVIDSVTFTLDGSTTLPAYTPPTHTWARGYGMLHDITAASNTCTLTTTAAHGLLVSNQIMVWGATSTVLAPQNGSGVYVIASTPTSTTATFACPGVADGIYDTDYDSTGTLPDTFLHYLLAVKVFPSLTIAGTGNSNYVSGGTLISAEDNKNFTEVRLIPYGITMALSPSSLNFAAILNGSAPASKNVTLTAAGTGSLDNWSATSDQTWFSVSPSGGTSAPATFAVTANPSGLALGPHAANICVSSTTSGISNSPTCIVATLNITGSPTMMTPAGIIIR
jgi:hypothetical protein